MIRPAIVADIWALRRRPQRRIFCYTEAMLASGYRPLAVSLRSMLGPLNDDVATLVLRNSGVRGYLQALKRAHAPELDLVYLAGFTGADQRMPNGDVWHALMEDAIARAGQARIERIFAAVGQRFDDVMEILRQLGFQAYAQQQIWMLPEPTLEAGSALVALRRQQRRDAWSIHQLYQRVTPRHVQLAELRQSSAWQLPRPRRRIGWRERGWVLGNDDTLQTYIHVLTGPRGHVLRMLIDPAARDLSPALLRYSLSQLSEPRTVFAVLRSYQSELAAALQELGFRLRGEQTLFVKHLTAAARQPVRVPGLVPNGPTTESVTGLSRLPYAPCHTAPETMGRDESMMGRV